MVKTPSYHIMHIIYTSCTCNCSILGLWEQGFLKIWKERYWPKNDKCKKPHVAEVAKLTDVKGLFYIIFGLVFIAMIILLLENLSHHLKHKRPGKEETRHKKSFMMYLESLEFYQMWLYINALLDIFRARKIK